MGLHSSTLCSRKFCLCSEAASAGAPFTLIFQHSTKTFGRVFCRVFLLMSRAFWEIPLGQLPPLSLPTGGNTSPWIYTATSSRALHPSHIFISSLASLDLLLSGLKSVFPAEALSCWEGGWSWSSTGSNGISDPPQRRWFCRLQSSLCKTSVVSLIILVWKRCGINFYLNYISLPNNQLSFPH